jgi:transposase
VRVTTAFNRLLALPGARVIDVSFCAEGVIVEVALRRRHPVCSGCGQVFTGMHDRHARRWRHLDLSGQRCFIEYRLRRVVCPDCGVRVEAVPWARAGARHTRDFENLTAFLAQQMAKTPIAALLRVGWETVGRIVERVVADRLDESRLCGLVQIGVDEIAYRKGQRYLTTVCDHRTGAIVWMRPGRNAATLQAFFTELGERRQSIRAVSIDMSGGYAKAVGEGLPDAEVCIDPFHVCQLASRAVDDVRREAKQVIHRGERLVDRRRRQPPARPSRAGARLSRPPPVSWSPRAESSCPCHSGTAHTSLAGDWRPLIPGPEYIRRLELLRGSRHAHDI